MAADARARLREASITQAEAARLHGELVAARGQASSDTTRLESHTEFIDQAVQELSRDLARASSVARAPRPTSTTPGQRSTDEAVLASLARLRSRSNGIRNELERRRRDAGLGTLHASELTDRRSSSRASGTRESAAESSSNAGPASRRWGRIYHDDALLDFDGLRSDLPPGAGSLSTVAAKKAAVDDDAEDEALYGLRPLRHVSLEERLIIGVPPSKGHKRPVEDATTRASVQRMRRGLKGR